LETIRRAWNVSLWNVSFGGWHKTVGGENIQIIPSETYQKEVGLFIYCVIQLNMEVFQLKAEDNSENKFKKYTKKKNLFSGSLEYNEKYNLIKQAEGEILSFYAKMAGEEVKKEDFVHLNQLIASVRNAMHSAKEMKDINQDRKEFSNSVNKQKYGSYELFRSQLSDFYSKLNAIFLIENKASCSSKLLALLEEIKINHDEILNSSYKTAGKEVMKEVDMSTLLNVNRELYSSCKAIIFALKDYLLDTASAEEFESTLVPVLKQNH